MLLANVFYVGIVKSFSNDIKANIFRKYAEHQGSDVIVFDKDTDKYWNKTYNTLTVKVDKSIGKISITNFRFVFPKKKN